MKYIVPKIHNRKSGIYFIRSTVNGKVYIGSTVNIRKRYREHKCILKSNQHTNIHLQRHYNKNGGNSLEYGLLELVTKDQLQDKEQDYVDKLDPEFNIMKECVVNRIGLEHSEKTKAKMKKASEIRRKRGDYKKMAKILSEANKGNKYNLGRKCSEETKKKISKKLKGRKLTKEEKQKISEGLKGRDFSDDHRKSLSKAMTGNKNNLGKTLSKEAKQKISKAKSIEINQLTLDGEYIKTWKSASHASRILCINQSNISSCTNGNRNKAGGFRWEKVNQK